MIKDNNYSRYDIIISMKRFLMVLMVLAFSVVSVPAFAISESQETSIVEHCDAIKDDLKNVQRMDSRTRVYLGGYYESILSKFITPLNMRLVENNLSTASFVENQNKFAEAKNNFVNSFISYQKNLEDLVAMDCKKEPAVFYEKLEKVREKRKIVGQDVSKIRSLVTGHVKLVSELKGKL